MKTPMMILSLCAAVALFGIGAFTSPAQAAAPTASVEKAAMDSSLGAAKFQVNLTWDGGATGVSQVAGVGTAAGITGQTIRFQPVRSVAMPNGSAFCYKTCPTVTCVPDCTKDFVLNHATSTYQTSDAGASPLNTSSVTILSAPPAILEPIQMGADKFVVISSLDAGNPNVNLFLETGSISR